MKQMQHDMTQIREYLNIHSTGRLKPNNIDPIHLRQELIRIDNWHFYIFLTITPISHDNKIILMIKLPLTDLELQYDSVQNLQSPNFPL